MEISWCNGSRWEDFFVASSLTIGPLKLCYSEGKDYNNKQTKKSPLKTSVGKSLTLWTNVEQTHKGITEQLPTKKIQSDGLYKDQDLMRSHLRYVECNSPYASHAVSMRKDQKATTRQSELHESDTKLYPKNRTVLCLPR